MQNITKRRRENSVTKQSKSRPTAGSSSSPSCLLGSQSSTSSSNCPASVQSAIMQPAMSGQQQQATHRLGSSSPDTPCRQIANLNLKSSTKTKPKGESKCTAAKLLSSKSLSQLLIPKGLFSRNSTKATTTTTTTKRLQTTKSFPNGAYQFDPTDNELVVANQNTSDQQQQQQASGMVWQTNQQFHLVDRICSDSLIVMPRHSTSSQMSCCSQSNSNNTDNDDDIRSRQSSRSSFGPATVLSPIVASVGSGCNTRNVFASTPTLKSKRVQDFIRSEGCVDENSGSKSTSSVDKDEQQSKTKCKKQTGSSEASNKQQGKVGRLTLSKCRPFKNTALALRDVKNSLGLRMKAKQESKAFARLTADIATPTPTTKLYSPFNINTCSSTKTDRASGGRRRVKEPTKSKRRLNLDKCSNLPATQQQSQIADESITSNQIDHENVNECEFEQRCRVVKGRIALQHKKHLIHVNKFNFDSPTGKLRESVRDVEKFQQCIEDISRAIEARGNELPSPAIVRQSLI